MEIFFINDRAWKILHIYLKFYGASRELTTSYNNDIFEQTLTNQILVRYLPIAINLFARKFDCNK